MLTDFKTHNVVCRHSSC